METILLTTLGGKPQVVTFALDWLLAQGETITQVNVLHLSSQDPRVRASLARLESEFPGRQQYRETGINLRYEPVELTRNSVSLPEIRDGVAAEAVWQFVYAHVAALKAGGARLHVCLAGGRRMMGLMAMSSAMLHFDHQDRLWHLFTPDELRHNAGEGNLMHVPPNAGVRLIHVPIVPWGAYFPGLRALTGLSAANLIAQQSQVLDREEHARCTRVRKQLTDRQTEVLRAFAANQTPRQVAEYLNISLRTVDAHKSVILDLCRNEWLIPTGGRLDYHFLREKFQDYFQNESKDNPLTL